MSREPSAAPTVSVVIPAYNVAPYIGEALRSVFAQTFDGYEIIVVNDGSPDTEEFERVLAPDRDRIRYIKQENRGAGAARNAALKAARGEFAAFLDADDVWLPAYLERQLAFIRERGGDLVCADAMIFGESPTAGRTFMDAYMEDAPAAGDVSFLELLSAERCLITSGILARIAPLLKIGAFDETLRSAQDYDLWLRLALSKARLSFHRETLLRYRVRSGSLTGDAISLNLRELRVLEKIERDYEFTPEERALALPLLRTRTSQLKQELGKLYLLKGDFVQSAESFARAAEAARNWKILAALSLIRVAPRLTRAFYARSLARKSR